MNGGGAFCIARYSYISSVWSRESMRKLTFWSYIVSFIGPVVQEECRWKVHIPSFALLSSPSCRIFELLTQMTCKMKRYVAELVADDWTLIVCK